MPTMKDDSMQIGVITLRNFNDPDPLNHYLFNSMDDVLYFLGKGHCELPMSVVNQIVHDLRSGQKISGLRFGEPNVYMQGETQDFNPNEVQVSEPKKEIIT